MSFRHDVPGRPAADGRAHPSWAALAPAEVPGPGVDRVVVVAAHPDDESLGAGGLVATAHAAGVEVLVVVATDGEASHPRSATHPPAVLAAVRRAEAAAAVVALAPGAPPPRLLGLPDGGLTAQEDDLLVALVELVGDGRGTLLVAPWRHDGHPDHEAAGRAAAVAAVRTGARLLEYPVWAWHWADPATAPWADLRALRLDPPAQERKQAGIAAHRSQVAPLGPGPGDETLLGPDLLAHSSGDVEVLVEQPAGADTALDDLHAAHADPWGVDRRWYEERKRSLVLAALPRRRSAAALEVGCSTGALAAALAQRCDRLLALDASPYAVAAARERLSGQAHVEVRRADVPDDWPAGPHDLVVVSEVGYFLSPAALDLLLDRLRATLADDGVLVLAHWRHPVRGWVLDGPDVHARVVAAGLRPVVARYVDRDVEVLVLAHEDLLPDPSGG